MPWPNAILACSIGRHDLYGRTRPATAPGKPNFGCWPKPALVNISHISRAGIGSAILAMPILGDFWMISDTLITPCECESWMVRSPICIEPGEVWYVVAG